MKRLLIALFLLAFILPPLQAAGLPPGFAEDEEDEEDQAPQRADVDYQQLLLKAMLEQVDEQEVLNLALDEERSFLLLQREALAAQPKGNLILLPADGHHPNWPAGIAPLRKHLSEYGWNTLTLSLPQYQPLGPPARTLPPGPLLARLESSDSSSTEDEADDGDEGNGGGFPGAFDEEDDEEEEEPQEQVDPAEHLAEQQAAVEERFLVALDHLGNDGRQVLALQGEAVFWLLPWLEAGNWPQQAPLILLNVRVPEGAQPEDLVQLLRELGNHPVLDIYDASSAEQQQLAQQRKAAYLRAGNKRSLQMSLEPASGQRQSSLDRWLTQRVEGWLRSLN
ncbi:DUF3530 family protein [Marinospirillum sp.]|uniref:DUF3530 family protein n=1 Tax=Marinospirillum sp. TaxID=2183934 RepID=UPI0028703039|nr:DUF3530 family protein [Marinospirillum sp.]MDR9466645.1 DUF3530 family protein [Marinospirillum sp.]